MTVQCRAMGKLTKQNFTVNHDVSLHILFVSAYWHYPEVMLEFVNKVRKRGHKVSVFLGDSQGKLDSEYVSRSKGEHGNQAGTSHPVKPTAKRIGKFLDEIM